MKSNKLVVLVIVAAVLVALAFWTSHQQQAAPPSDVGKKLIPSLALASIGRVEIAHSGAPVTLVRGDDGWTVSNLFGYPADLSKLQSALLKLTAQKIVEVARGVNIDTNATLVDLQDASGKPLVTLRLGSQPTAERAGYRAPQGRYVAVAGNNQVYLVKEGLEEFDAAPNGWVNNSLLNITFSDIQTIDITSPANGTYTLARNGGSMELQNVATNKEEFDSSKSYGVESAICYLSFTGVADPKLTDAQTGLTTGGTYRVTLKSGDLYTAHVGSAAAGGDRYLRMDVQLAPPGTNATAQTEYTTRKAEMDQKFSKWTYLISSSTAENMTRPRSDLVKPKTTSTNTTTTASSDTPVQAGK